MMGQVKPNEGENALLPRKFIAPNLDTPSRRLHISGHNFAPACMVLDNTSWTRAIQFINIYPQTICRRGQVLRHRSTRYFCVRRIYYWCLTEPLLGNRSTIRIFNHRELRDGWPYSECLSLSGINRMQNLAGTLLLWQESEFSLIDCSVFSEKVLRAMSEQIDTSDTGISGCETDPE
ncbi:hypothetical protein BJ138DRAFT_1160262 [Hygrophoropsis aurantiaca]|uniref:Uncharacterized protein n=1 Tax=Hygrophoropsis aurantiaca TaxID=72124 RepID=A0ACB8A348_9AGAM|nr:hypothetical protein BJ138DRAFT_1160262 [Hygrophoropsis aurantiaca]